MAITSSIFDDSIQGTIFILIVVLTPLSVLATVLRFLASRLSSRKLGPEDWFALGALLFYLGWVTIALLSIAPEMVQLDQLRRLIKTVLSNLDGRSIAELDFPSLTKVLKVHRDTTVDGHHESCTDCSPRNNMPEL